MRDDSGEMLQNAPFSASSAGCASCFSCTFIPCSCSMGRRRLSSRRPPRVAAPSESDKSRACGIQQKILLNQVSAGTRAHAHARTHARTRSPGTRARAHARARGFSAAAAGATGVQMKGRHLLHGWWLTRAGPAAARRRQRRWTRTMSCGLADQFGEQDAVVGGLSSGAAQAAQATAAQPGASSSTAPLAARHVSPSTRTWVRRATNAHAAVGSRHPAYPNDGLAAREPTG